MSESPHQSINDQDMADSAGDDIPMNTMQVALGSMLVSWFSTAE